MSDIDTLVSGRVFGFVAAAHAWRALAAEPETSVMNNALESMGRALRLFCWLLAAILVGGCGLHAPGAATDEPRAQVAFVNAEVVDVTRGMIAHDLTVLVTDGRIARVGADQTVLIPADATIVDARGRFLAPGLWDMHVHTLREDRLPSYLPAFIAHGVTGVRDMGAAAPLEQTKAWRDAINRGDLLGPRIVAAGKMIDGDPPTYSKEAEISVATPDAARAAVQMIASAGLDFAKVYSALSPGEFAAIAVEARAVGLPFAGHIPERVDAGDASDAGMASIEHTFGLAQGCARNRARLERKWTSRLVSETWFNSRFQMEAEAFEDFDPARCAALLDRLARNHTFVTPTLAVTEGFIRWNEGKPDPALGLVPAKMVASWTSPAEAATVGGIRRQLAPQMLEAFRRVFAGRKRLVGEMAKRGVPLLAGSDTCALNNPPGASLLRELELEVAAGLSPAQALRAATLAPAEFLHREKDFGTVAEGKSADLILLDANPLDDISAVRKVRAVMLAGRLFDRPALDALLAEAQQQAARH